MTYEDYRFSILLLQELRSGNIISDTVAGKTVKIINNMWDVYASHIFREEKLWDIQ